ncbi:hypothetical protein [Candidatus Phytoplasma tritici]|nr:hypothetical protein [Candidatus Phytoplasma tritici]
MNRLDKIFLYDDFGSKKYEEKEVLLVYKKENDFHKCYNLYQSLKIY